jgi:hypothetical protein
MLYIYIFYSMQHKKPSLDCLHILQRGQRTHSCHKNKIIHITKGDVYSMSAHSFSDAPSTFMLRKRHGVHPNQQFQPLPLPTGKAPYHLKLEDVLSSDRMTAIRNAKKLVFQTTGDTGGQIGNSSSHCCSAYGSRVEYQSLWGYFLLFLGLFYYFLNRRKEFLL